MSYFPGSCQGIVLKEGLNQGPLRFPLQIWYSQESITKGGPVNRAIAGITKEGAHTPKAWCGPVIVLKFSGTRLEGYSDAGECELATLSAYFIEHQ